MSKRLPHKFADKLDFVICPHCGAKIPINLLANFPPHESPKCPYCLKPYYSHKPNDNQPRGNDTD